MTLEQKLKEIKDAFLAMCEEGHLEKDVDADYDEGHWRDLTKWRLSADPMWFEDFCASIGVTDAELEEVKHG